MSDIWSLLLQTLTASGVAVLLLAVKAMFRDKLSPRWQFGVWGILAVILLLPAGWGGRYVLLNWPMLVEAAKSAATGEFGTLTRVTAPVPLPPSAAPGTLADWLYLVYLAGVVVLLARYIVSYVVLRRALRRGRPAQAERVKAAAERYSLSVCPAVEVDGLPSAFICGLFRPVLALPAGVETDERVILHELLHLTYRDVFWGWVICFFRCVHWCNPLIWLCADRAGNDLESLCDQRVLERLEGEERRDYGRILLSMADEKYARAPGTSSAANGGQNIARRIQAIARFKRYPAGMALVSVCVALVLAVPLVLGARAEASGNWRIREKNLVMAYARSARCTTCAGAFDTYAKAVLTGDIPFLAMCAPLSEQNELAAACGGNNVDWVWERAGGVQTWPEIQSGYQIYNLTRTEDGAWEGLLALTLIDAPEGEEWDGTVAGRWLAVQPLRAEKEGSRWVVLPQGAFQAVQGDARSGGNLGVPAWVYEGQYGDFTVRVQWQTTACVNSYFQDGTWFWNTSSFDPVPQPHGEFDRVECSYMIYAVYSGDPDKKDEYNSISVSCLPLYGGSDERPELEALDEIHLGIHSSSSSSDGSSSGTNILEHGWDDWIFLSGGGGCLSGDELGTYGLPSAYAVDLYLNGEFAAELTLLPEEGGEWIER